jgi:hypothetical protein
MTQIFRVIKLRSGEELIAEIAGSENGKVTLSKPMIFKTISIPDSYGNIKEGVILKNWLSFGKQSETTIPTDFIATTLEPTPDVMSYYLAEQDRENLPMYEKTPLADLVNPKVTDDQDLNAAEYENMIQDMFENLFNEVEKTKLPKTPKPNKRKPKSKEMENVIHMSLVFSPQVLANMINDGLIDPRDIMDMINHFNLSQSKKKKKRKTGESINEHRYTGDEKDRDGFGNKWTDWNPDPLSDEYQ